MFVYRADNREPGEISKSGFKARKDLSLAGARSLIKIYCGNPNHPGDLGRLIVSSPQPEFVSTALNPGVGGYGHRGYIYAISIPVLSKRAWSQAVIGPKFNLSRVQAVWPALWLDSPRLDSASVIALRQFGHASEMTFLTAIPGGSIRWYRKSGDKGWRKITE